MGCGVKGKVGGVGRVGFGKLGGGVKGKVGVRERWVWEGCGGSKGRGGGEKVKTEG